MVLAYQWVGREGYYRDEEASELNLGRRHYDTATGRFTTEDPIGYHSGDSNFYRYVGNNPIVRVDPDGLQPPQPPKLSPPPPASYSSVARSAVRLGRKFAAEMSSGVYKAFGEDGKVSDLLDPLDRFLTELQPLTRTVEQSGLLTSGMASQIRGLLSDLISLIREVKAILPEEAVQVALDLVQVILGVIGLIPLLGEAADAVDAGISLARRDWIGAGLGVVNLIPVVSIGTGAAVLFARKFPRLIAGIKGLGPKARQLMQLIKSRLSKALEILPEPVKRRLEGFFKTLDDAAPPEPKLTPPERRTLETPASTAKSEQLKTIPEMRIDKVESAGKNAPRSASSEALSVVTREGSFPRNVDWFDEAAVLEELSSSPIGKTVLEAAESNQFRLEFSKSFYRQSRELAAPENQLTLGVAMTKKAKVFLPAHSTNAGVARTAVHEGTHLLGVRGSIRAEVLARAAEVLHAEGKITPFRLKQIYREVLEIPVYKSLPRSVGQQSALFPGVEF